MGLYILIYLWSLISVKNITTGKTKMEKVIFSFKDTKQLFSSFVKQQQQEKRTGKQK